jgi:hypothetical protein
MTAEETIAFLEGHGDPTFELARRCVLTIDPNLQEERNALKLWSVLQPIEAASLEAFWRQQAAWSQATFGPDSERGPIGPLKHLAKEVAEVMQDPTDLMEFVDCLFLIFDSTRRAGFTFAELRAAAWKKLEINKARKWQAPPKGDEAIEHVRD